MPSRDFMLMMILFYPFLVFNLAPSLVLVLVLVPHLASHL